MATKVKSVTKAKVKAAKPKDRKKAAVNAWTVRRKLYGKNGISDEVLAERAKAKAEREKAEKAKAAKKSRPAPRKSREAESKVRAKRTAKPSKAKPSKAQALLADLGQTLTEAKAEKA